MFFALSGVLVLPMRAAWRALKQRRYSRSFTTQVSYDELCRLPHFDIAALLSEKVAVLMVTITFSAGMPILVLVAALYIVVSGKVEKWMLLRCCRQPPAFSADLMIAAMYVLPAAVLAHCIIG